MVRLESYLHLECLNRSTGIRKDNQPTREKGRQQHLAGTFVLVFPQCQNKAFCMTIGLAELINLGNLRTALRKIRNFMAEWPLKRYLILRWEWSKNMTESFHFRGKFPVWSSKPIYLITSSFWPFIWVRMCDIKQIHSVYATHSTGGIPIKYFARIRGLYTHRPIKLARTDELNSLTGQA